MKILVGKGEHFWFQCKDDIDRDFFASSEGYKRFKDPCESGIGLGEVEMISDRYQMSIEAMECSMRSLLNPGSDPEFNQYFN